MDRGGLPVLARIRLILGPSRAIAARPDEGLSGSGLGTLSKGFLTNALNPKVGVFYVTLLPQFVPLGVNAAVFSFALAGMHVLLGIVWSAVLIAATVPLGRVLTRPKVIGALDRTTGGIFIAFGVKLALANRP